MSHPTIIPDLDLVEDSDQITHNVSLDDEIDPDRRANMFRVDPDYERTEQEWEEFKTDILGEDNLIKLRTANFAEDVQSEQDSDDDVEQIKEYSEQDILDLRLRIFKIIMSSKEFEECAHKLLRLGVGTGKEDEFCKMIIDCCINQRTYQKFFGLLAERFCNIDDVYK